MDCPKISVIVPVRNAEAFLDQCINGLVNQSLQSIEIVCVDDESTDASKEILLKYARRDDRIKVYSQSKAGAGAARNLGMSRASGEYFAFIDADDFVEADYLEEMLGQCRLHDADICLCAADIYNNSSGAFEKAPWMLDEKLIKSKPFNVADAGGDFFHRTERRKVSRRHAPDALDAERIQKAVERDMLALFDGGE